MQRFFRTFVYSYERMKERLSDISEKTLIDMCRKGDRNAQMELYYRYYRAMYNTSLRILGRSDDAEDAMQEAFIKAFRRLTEFEGRSGLGLWLKRIVINTSIDKLRKRRKLMEAELSEESTPEEEDETSASDKDEDIEIQAEQIRKAILQLPEGYRIVVSLYLLEGYDHEEIGKILGISNSTARSQFARGRKKLIEILKGK
jgi:RNA polymerase sigma-70 factor (ECF subfamily)